MSAGAPPKYDLDCGHCGCSFVGEGVSPGNSIKCPVCGGACLVVERPTPPTLPPPAPVPAPLAIRERAKKLEPPWDSVYSGLQHARYAAYGAILLGAPLLCVGSFAPPFVPDAQRGPVEHFLWWLLAALLIPAAVHFSAQGRCGEAPESHGQHFASASYFICLLGFACWFLLRPPNWGWLVAVASLVSFGVWLRFFVRLGAAFGDGELHARARACATGLVFGLVQVAILLAGSQVATGEKRPVAAGFFRLGASGLVLLYLWRYATLTRLAERTVARCAPVRRDG